MAAQRISRPDKEEPLTSQPRFTIQRATIYAAQRSSYSSPLQTSSDSPICWPRCSEFNSPAGGPLACASTGKRLTGFSNSDPGMFRESTLAKASTSPGPMLAITGIPLLGPRTLLVSKPLLNHWRQAHTPFRSSQASFSSTLRPLSCSPASWFRRNTRQPGPWRSRRGTMYFATVASETFSPNLSSSPWIRGAPQRQLAWLICPIKLTNSASSGGRPTLRLPLALRQHFQIPSRRQRNTVAGLATTRALGQRSQTVDSKIQKNRSAPLNCGLRRDPCMTSPSGGRAQCSNTSSQRDRSADVKVARPSLTDEIIVGQQSVADLLETQQIPCGWNFC